MAQNKINIAVLLGDPSGIGPELVSKLLSEEITNKANLIVIGEKNILESGNKISGKSHNLNFVEDFDNIDFAKGDKFFLDISNGKNHNYKLSECSKEAGESVLASLNLALDLVKENKIHAINFGPFNKTSLKLGGNKYSDELHLMAEKLEVKNFFCEFNVIDNFWTARVSSHIPIKEVSHGKGPSALIPSFFASSIAGIISSFSSVPNSA